MTIKDIRKQIIKTLTNISKIINKIITITTDKFELNLTHIYDIFHNTTFSLFLYVYIY
jgi:hypothetical protein